MPSSASRLDASRQPREAGDSAIPPTLRSYLYISDAKVGAYLGQLTTIERRHMAMTFGVNVGLLHFALEAGKESVENRITRLDAVEAAIRRTYSIGSAAEPSVWFGGTTDVVAATFPDDENLMFFFADAPSHFLGLVGSAHHIIGNQRSTTANTSLSHQASALANLRWIESARYDMVGRGDEVIDFDLRSGIKTTTHPWTGVLAEVASRFGQDPPVRVSFLARRLVSERLGERLFTLASPLYLATVDE